MIASELSSVECVRVYANLSGRNKCGAAGEGAESDSDVDDDDDEDEAAAAADLLWALDAADALLALLFRDRDDDDDDEFDDDGFDDDDDDKVDGCGGT